MRKTIQDVCDFTAAVGIISLIPTGTDGELIMPLAASLGLIGGAGLIRLGIFLFNPLSD